MDPMTIQYETAPQRLSLSTEQVMDLFGLDSQPAKILIARDWTPDIRAGDVVLFHGPSGSGKSSLLREVGRQFGAIDAAALELPNKPLADAWPGSLDERLAALAACGLSEARLLLRTPSELSEGQRYRFRLAYALSQTPKNGFLMADEFAAFLDRPLAKVVAYNLRKICTLQGRGALLATTHEDLIDDLQPDYRVHCLGEGRIEMYRNESGQKKTELGCRDVGSPKVPEATGRISLGGIIDLTISVASLA